MTEDEKKLMTAFKRNGVILSKEQIRAILDLAYTWKRLEWSVSEVILLEDLHRYIDRLPTRISTLTSGYLHS